MQYTRPFTFLFNQPHFTMTLLVGSVLMFIPVVGHIVLMGWVVRVHRALLSGTEEVPPLTFDSFSRDLNLGLGPFVVALIIGLIGGGVLSLLMVVGVAGTFLSVPLMLEAGHEDAMVIVVATLIGAIFTLPILIISYTVGMARHAALIRAELRPAEGTAALSWGYLKGVLRLVKKELLFATIVNALVSSVLVSLGFTFMYVFAFPAMVVITAAGAHFRAQIYSLYLVRGGPPIDIQPLEGEPQEIMVGRR